MRNLRLASWALASGVALWSFSGVAMAERRVALVVGNSAYQHASRLANPGNDATAMAEALEELDFKVILGIDLSRRGFFDKLSEFGNAAETDSMALFFYAGHASQYQDKNYLAPIDAKLENENDYHEWHIELDAVMKSMRSSTRVVFLDSCRNNPLKERLVRSRGVPVSRGLARVEGGLRTYIAYATAPGKVADDGTGRHSPFTEALLQHIRTPDLSVGDMIGHVSDSVVKSTRGKQVPWSSFTGKPFFLSKSRVVPPPPRSNPGVYLKFNVDAGEKIRESHLEVIAESRIFENEVRNYSMLRGGCYSGWIPAGTRLGWKHISFCTR